MADLVLVSGLGRCGSSLLMQMLDAGDYPIYDSARSYWPAYEISGLQFGRVAWNPETAAGALKWLDPHRCPPPKHAGAIWLTRDHNDQATSQIKFMRAGSMDTRGVTVRQLARFLAEEETQARAILAAAGRVLRVQFSELIARPNTTLGEIADFLNFTLDYKRAAACVRERETGAKCLPYLLEQRMLNEESVDAR